MEFTSLQSIDHADALIDCVYSAYGLTFHRDYIYHPRRFIELNRRGHIASQLAIEDGRVIGHMACIRPFFELERDGRPVCDRALLEVGLSIVRKECRGQKVQERLGAAIIRHARSLGAFGIFMKCVTLHTYSQRSAAHYGGVPLALFLGGIPRWVVYDEAQPAKPEPLSTVLFLIPFEELGRRRLCVPPQLDWIAELAKPLGGELVIENDGELESGPTDLEVAFQPPKRLAQVHVLHAGEDLVERLIHLKRWLLSGHILHVTFFLPADSPRVGLSIPQLQEDGFLAGGWLPALHPDRRDVLVFQAIGHKELDLEAIDLYGYQARHLMDRLLAAWKTGDPA